MSDIDNKPDKALHKPSERSNPDRSERDLKDQAAANNSNTTTSSDPTSSPELISHAEAHEEFEQISKEGIPSPEELEQNGKPYGGGGKQHIMRSAAEMSKQFMIKYMPDEFNKKRRDGEMRGLGKERGAGGTGDEDKRASEEGGLGEDAEAANEMSKGVGIELEDDTPKRKDRKDRKKHLGRRNRRRAEEGEFAAVEDEGGDEVEER